MRKIENTEDLYFIDEELSKTIRQRFTEGNVCFAYGFKWVFKESFKEISVDGVIYRWCGTTSIPTIYKSDDEKNFTPYQKEVFEKLKTRTDICSVSEYKRDEESYLKRQREKKLERIVK
jgi:hypothetical protein